MVVDQARADRAFHALADGTRRDILAVVLHEAQSVTALARRYPMSFAAVQKHVAVLERAGLVRKQKIGREQRVHGESGAVREVHDLLDALEACWRARLDRIDALVTTTRPDPDHHTGARS